MNIHNYKSEEELFPEVSIFVCLLSDDKNNQLLFLCAVTCQIQIVIIRHVKKIVVA